MKTESKKTKFQKEREIHPSLKFLLEVSPLGIFFLVTFMGKNLINTFEFLGVFGKPLFIATALFMVATFISLALSWIWRREIPIVPLVSAIMVLFFGSLSIWLQDDTFIKIKPTILYSLLSFLLFIGAILEKPLPSYLFGATLELDTQGWKKLSFRWGLACLMCAILNEIVWRGLEKMLPPDLADTYWASFKLFGLTGMTFAFVLSQMPMIRRHLIKKPNDPNEIL